MDSIYSLSRCSQFHISEDLIMFFLQSIGIRITPNTFCKIATLIFLSLHFVANPILLMQCVAPLSHTSRPSPPSFLLLQFKGCVWALLTNIWRKERNLFPVHFVTPEYVMLDMRIRLYPRFFMQRSKPEHKQRVPQCKKFTLHSAQWVWKICVSKKMSDTECHAAQSGQKCTLCKKCNNFKP